MAKRIPCYGKAGKCEEKATLSLQGFAPANVAWQRQFYCGGCAGRVIKLRAKLIKRHGINVVIRPITERDRATIRPRKRKD